MTKWYIKEIVEICPNSRHIKILYTDGFRRWIKTFDMEDSQIPTTIIDEQD